MDGPGPSPKKRQSQLIRKWLTPTVTRIGSALVALLVQQVLRHYIGGDCR